MLAGLHLPLGAELSEVDSRKRSRRSATKVVLELRPITSATLQARILANMKMYTEDPKKHKDVLGRSRVTDNWISVCDTLGTSAIMSFILIADRLTKLGIIEDIHFAQTSPYNLFTNPDQHGTHDTMIAFAAGMGLLEGANDLRDRDINTKNTSDKYKKLLQELIRTVYWTGEYSQLSFSYVRSATTGKMEEIGMNRNTHKPSYSTTEGKMLCLQHNHHLAFIASLFDTVRRQQDHIVGRIIKGAEYGGVVDIRQ
jgi:hypothetical protein